MYKLLLIFLIAFQSVTIAQDIYFCQSHTEDGEPIGAANTWSIDSDGGYVYILLQTDQKLTDHMYYLFVDKKIDGKYEPYDSKVLRKNGNNFFLVYNYIFKEEGNYSVYFMDSNQKRIAEEEVKIIKEKEEIRRDYSSLYYDNTRIITCERVIAVRPGEKVIEEKPLNITNKSSLSINDGMLYVYIENDERLNTNVILADIWRKGDDSFDFNEYIDSKQYRTDPNWKYTFFKYRFPRTGQYKITIYNDKEVPMGSVFVSIGD